jgi:hypothetical protein
MYMDAKKNFDRLKAKGLVGRNYTHILAMLMRSVFSSIFVLLYTDPRLQQTSTCSITSESCADQGDY